MLQRVCAFSSPCNKGSYALPTSREGDCRGRVKRHVVVIKIMPYCRSRGSSRTCNLRPRGSRATACSFIPGSLSPLRARTPLKRLIQRADPRRLSSSERAVVCLRVLWPMLAIRPCPTLPYTDAPAAPVPRCDSIRDSF